MSVIVPPSALDQETLRRVLESFVSREGTDYGPRVFTLEEKVDALRRQLTANEIYLTYDAESDSINLIPRDRAGPLLEAQGLS